MINFYNRFVPSAAAVLQPLTESLKGTEKLISWTSEMEAVFVKSKEALAHAAVHPQSEAQTSLTVDASDLAVGGVLEQRIMACGNL